MTYKYLSPLFILSLAACGGAGIPVVNDNDVLVQQEFEDDPALFEEEIAELLRAAPTVQPLSSLGFYGHRTEESVGDTAVRFTLPAAPRFKSIDGIETRIENQDVQVIFDYATGEEMLSVVVDGETYDLSPSIQDPRNLVFLSDTADVRFRTIGVSFNVGISNVFVVTEDEFGGDVLNSGFVIIGLDTHPFEIAALEGSATYVGDVAATVRSDNYQLASGAGTFELVADFDGGSVSGTAVVPELRGNDPNSPVSRLDIAMFGASIVENGFGGEIVVQDGRYIFEPGNGSYEGRFFHEDGIVVGGTMQAEMVADPEGEKAHLIVGFLGVDDRI